MGPIRNDARNSITPGTFRPPLVDYDMGYTVQYYDVVLGAIFGALVVGALLGAFTPVQMPVAIVVLGAVALGLMGHAMFVNGPVDGIDDLTQEVESGPIEDVPLLE